MNQRLNNLKHLLSPRHIAFIGGQGLRQAINNCQKIGFSGEIWVVNPKHKTIAGLTCYPSITDLPKAPDASFIAVRNHLTIPIVHDLAARGSAGCVCYAAGFAELAHGKTLQEELVAAAGDMALVGPNCYGMLNYLDGVALWPDYYGSERVDEGVAIIGQSGTIVMNLTMNDRSLPISHAISVGNQAVLGLGHYVEALVADPRVKAIGLYIESVRDMECFSRAALLALEKGIPLVALKTGTSQLSSQITLTHTGSMAGSDKFYQAWFDRLGIIRVYSLSELLEVLKLITVTGGVTGTKIGVLTCSGGDSSMVADLADNHALDIPALGDNQCHLLRQELPDFASVSNPLDYNTSVWGQRKPLEACFNIMMSGDFDATLLVIDYPSAQHSYQEVDIAIEAFIAAKHQTNSFAIVASSLAELLPSHARQQLMKAAVAPMQGLAEAIKAIKASAWYYCQRKKILGKGNALQRPFFYRSLLAEPTNLVNEYDSKSRLAAFGLSIPRGKLATIATAAAVATEIGFPVVAKAVHHQLTHKSDVGAVELNLANAAAVECAVNRIKDKMTKAIADFDDVFLIEHMVSDVVAELIIGLHRNERLGLALLIGSGGIHVDLFQDSTVLLLPTHRTDVEEALDKLVCAKLLKGYRGRPKGDYDAVIDSIMALARYAEHHNGELLELDINPLLVLPPRQGALVADALMRITIEH